MRELSTNIEISASAKVVWDILTDFDRFAEWNPFIPEARGDLQEGQRLNVRIAPPDGKGMTFKPTIKRVIPERQLRWLGRFIFPGLFDGEHVFEIEVLSEDRVRFVQREKFSGLLVSFLWRSLDTNTRRGFDEMNEALKNRAEELMSR